MERQAHYAVVGLVTFVLFVCLMAFTFWFVKFDFNESYGIYDVEFNTPVDGLTKGAEVHFNGIKVGEVTDLRLGNANTHQVFARVQLDASTPIRADSIASLEPQGVTGLYYMQISPGTAKAPLLKHNPDQPPPIIHSEESALSKLLQGSGSVIENTYESLNRVNRLLSDENIKTFSQSLDNLQEITADLKSRKQILDDAHEAIVSASQAADAVTQLANTTNGTVGTNVPQSLEKINAAADKLAVAADNFSKTTASIQAPFDTVQKTTLPELQESMHNLNDASVSLKQLVDEVRDDPRGMIAKAPAKERKVSQ
ncbi:MAG TPA: MlaD family protein [Asticcacaulis sp.]|nr:MlaD family protein [Asticcacaulis sp.]